MIEIIRTRREFIALQDEWNALADPMGDPLLRHEFFGACVDTYTDRVELAIFVLRSNGAVRAIAPLHVARYRGVRRLEMLSRRINEPTAFLCRDNEAPGLLLEAAIGRGLPVFLNRLGLGSPEAQSLRAPLGERSSGLVAKGRVFAHVVDGSDVAYVPLPRDFRELEAAMSGNRRSFLRKNRKRAERFGEVTFEAVSPDADTVGPLLEEVFRVESSGWKQRTGTGVLSNPYTQRLYTAYGHAAARLGLLRLFVLRIGGQAVAVRMAVEHGHRLWELRIGYDEAFRECSPGILLTHETLRHACEQGLAAHEFLGKREAWEEMWPCAFRRCQTFRIYPLSFGGAACFSLDLGLRAHRRLIPAARAAVQA